MEICEIGELHGLAMRGREERRGGRDGERKRERRKKERKGERGERGRKERKGKEKKSPGYYYYFPLLICIKPLQMIFSRDTLSCLSY